MHVHLYFLLHFWNRFNILIGVSVLVDDGEGSYFRHVSLDMKKTKSFITLHWKYPSADFFSVCVYKMSKCEMHKIHTHCLLAATLPLFLLHTEHLVAYAANPFSTRLLKLPCPFLHIPHHVWSEGGRRVWSEGGQGEAGGMAWGEVGTLEFDWGKGEKEKGGGGGGRKKDGKAKSVLYFYRVHSPSCPLKFPLHAFLIPTAGNKMNLELQSSRSFRKTKKKGKK